MMVPSRLFSFHLVSALILAGLGSDMVGCASSPAPAQEFIAQADRLHEEALAPTILRSDDLNDYIQEIGQRIINAAREAAPDQTSNPFFSQIRFQLVSSKVPNIFPTGGKDIYLYAGLLTYCQNEEELATAMSEAYAHLLNLDLEHTAMHPDPKRSVRADVWDYASNPYSSAQDLQADRLAFRIFQAAGYDGSKFENLFQRVDDSFHAPPVPGRASLNDRTANAHQLSKSALRDGRRPPVADKRTFNALRQLAANLLAKQNPPKEDETYLLAFPNLILSHELPEEQAAQEQLRPPKPVEVKLEPN